MAQDKFQSVPDMFLYRVRSTPDSEAFLFPKNGGWETMSWKDVGEDVRDIACGLSALGLQAEERCSIMAGTRVEWILSDIGILCATGATTTIYPTNTAEECAYIIQDSESRIVFAENEEQVDKLIEQRENLPSVEKVVVFDGHGGHA